MTNMSIALAQFSPVVGDIEGNTLCMLKLIEKAKLNKQSLIVFPELSLTGYVAEDLFLHPDLERKTRLALEKLTQQSDELMIIVGFAEITAKNKRYNSAAVLHQSKQIAVYRKQCLPNYTVFDEKRYFDAGEQDLIFKLNGHKFALLICEDVWQKQQLERLKQLKVDTLLVLNASPFETGKRDTRISKLQHQANQFGFNILYVNQVGGQDDLVFDGNSFVVDQKGQLVAKAAAFEQQFLTVELNVSQNKFNAEHIKLEAANAIAEMYQALVLATRDYVQRSGFTGVLLGLSGGIDSALTLAIAVDALGSDKVQAVMMPYIYTADISVEDATEQARRLNIAFAVTEINSIMQSYQQTLQPFFESSTEDNTEENIQARIRGSLLMALSNKYGNLVLSTGNKSELAVGYCTLYGDMVGSYAVLKDVYKSLVFELAKYRNSLESTPVIPERVITRPPSAELRPDQKDEDSLPPYDVLDAILYSHIEENQTAEQIISQGFDAQIVQRVLSLVKNNEYKRRQAALGPRVSDVSFGRSRRFPLAYQWND